MKYREIIADNLRDAGWSLGWVSAIDFEARTIWIVDAHRDDARRFVVHADEILSAFVELERQVLTMTFYRCNFEVVVPIDGRLQHFFHDNPNVGLLFKTFTPKANATVMFPKRRSFTPSAESLQTGQMLRGGPVG
jgi:hypothetical protein